MAEEKEKGVENGQKTNPSTGAKDELSEEDLKKAAGGSISVIIHDDDAGFEVGRMNRT